VIGAVAMAKTMLCLDEIGMEALADHEADLTAYLLEGMNRIPGLTIYGMSDPARARERVGVVPFNVEGMSHFKTAAILSAEGGIAVRNGCFCAHPYLLSLLNATEEQMRLFREGIFTNNRVDLPGMVRASFGCYNTLEEVDHFLEMLGMIAAGDYAGNYVQDTASGEFWDSAFPAQAGEYWSLR
jgi:selenocysteine lyase/cysteine desulfurase